MTQYRAHSNTVVKIGGVMVSGELIDAEVDWQAAEALMHLVGRHEMRTLIERALFGVVDDKQPKNERTDAPGD